MKKIISGGQTGADRAALDACLELGFSLGGYCPKGRLAEDGPIDLEYPLIEIEGGYRQRTKMNVAESDGTVIFYASEPHGGTELTILFAAKGRKLYKLYKLIDIDLVTGDSLTEAIMPFVGSNRIDILNVAGPR